MWSCDAMLRTGQAAGSHAAESAFHGVRDSENETLTPESFVAL